MSSFEINRCNDCYEDNVVKINCENDKCNLSIEHQDRKMECYNKSTILECLYNPDKTYVNGIENVVPIQWLIRPKEIANSIHTTISPCGQSSDNSCIPYYNLDKDGEKCLSDKTKCQYSYNNATVDKDTMCQLMCPSNEDQELIGRNKVCDRSYYDLCIKSGCTIDKECETLWKKNWGTRGVNLKPYPNKLPNVISDHYDSTCDKAFEENLFPFTSFGRGGIFNNDNDYPGYSFDTWGNSGGHSFVRCKSKNPTIRLQESHLNYKECSETVKDPNIKWNNEQCNLCIEASKDPNCKWESGYVGQCFRHNNKVSKYKGQNISNCHYNWKLGGGTHILCCDESVA